MPPLSTLRAKTAANPNSVSNGGTPAPVSSIAPENLVQIPAAAPLDLPVPMPQRGVFPPQYVFESDRSDSTRVFRSSNTRSAVFQNKQQPVSAAQIAAAISTPAAVAAAVEILVNNQKTTSQSILNFINSTTVQWQAGANGQISATAAAAVGDGLTHLEPNISAGSWESDPAYIILRDDFIGFFDNLGLPQPPTIGQLGWAQLNGASGGGGLRGASYYTAGNMGILKMSSNSSTAGVGTSVMLSPSDTSATATQGFPLTYVGGWQAEFVFRYPKFISAAVSNPATKLRLYIGFASSPTVAETSTIFAPRPASFIGLRYDTDPNVWTLSAAANALVEILFTRGHSQTFPRMRCMVSLLQLRVLLHTLLIMALLYAWPIAQHPSHLANASGVAETQAATATGAAFSDTGYVFEATQNGHIGSNIQGLTASTGVAIDNNWHRFRMRSLVAGTILMSLDGGTESSFTIGAQTLTAGSGSSQYLSFFQALNSGGFQVTELTQPISTGMSPCPGTPVTIAGVSGGTLGAFNGTWNNVESQPESTLYFDTSAIASNGGGNSTAGTAQFFNAFAPFMMMMNDSTSGNAAKSVYIDFFSFVWNPGLSTAGGTPVATNPQRLVIMAPRKINNDLLVETSTMVKLMNERLFGDGSADSGSLARLYTLIEKHNELLWRI